MISINMPSISHLGANQVWLSPRKRCKNSKGIVAARGFTRRHGPIA
jgi:hypothetical protein